MFPLLLAALGWIGLAPLEAGRWINATAFGLTILAAGLYLRSHLRAQSLTLAATAIIAASLPLSYWAAYFFTDPLFVLLTLLALIQLATFLNRKTAAPLLLSAVFTALAAITRYPGVVLVGTGVLVLLSLARLKHTLIFGAISSIPLLTVLAYNSVVSETWTGRGTRVSGQSLADGLHQAIEVFHEWIVPPNMPTELAPLLWLTVAAVGLTSAAVVLRAARTRSNVRLEPALPFAAFAVIYLVFMVAVVPFTVTQGIDSRYLLPIYVPLLLTAVFLIDRFLSINSSGAAKWSLASLVLLGTLAHIGFSTQENLRITDKAYVVGYHVYSYNAAYMQQSELLNYISNHPIEGRIYSNHAPLAWFGGRTAAPGKYQPIPSGLPHLAWDMMQWPKDGDRAHIVWFREFGDLKFYGYDVMDLRLLSGIEIVAELADGVVFRVTAAEPFDEAKHRARRQPPNDP